MCSDVDQHWGAVIAYPIGIKGKVEHCAKWLPAHVVNAHVVNLIPSGTLLYSACPRSNQLVWSYVAIDLENSIPPLN